jgi:hypothetical protein
MIIINLPNSSGVYAVVNTKSDKRLICYSKNMKHNASQIFWNLICDRGQSNELIRNDYKVDASFFTVELLELTEDKDRVYYYMFNYDSIKNGYNVRYKSDTNLYQHLPSNSGVYLIQNLCNNKVYVGSGDNIKRRVRDHFGDLRRNSHYIESLQNDWNESHKFKSFVLQLNEDYTDLEKLYILKFKSYIPESGYNTLIGSTPVNAYFKNMSVD